MAADPARVTAVRQIAADISWARTPNRTERTAPGHRASPLSLDYWIAQVRAEGVVREEDVEAAAQSAFRASQRARSLKAAETRKANAEQRRKPNTARRTA
ncbi:hypothetical protein ACFFV7_51155 [Nonomuraea spiralis]|uniref:Uncharacterized protein n=1 Tax=Nonomuraea spiralis TaxID=46182 RepID=A0ABV5IYR9_9ACTN|nr:hypothetical protein [Nonomuraea spiralis]GGS88216.1 hypothetical protein GCM10010176_034960 [Nonomuraea spiralis]